jgi:hypothetical protein
MDTETRLSDSLTMLGTLALLIDLWLHEPLVTRAPRHLMGLSGGRFTAG